MDYKLKECTLTEEGISLEFGDFRLLMPYGYTGDDKDKIKEDAEKQGGVLPSIDEALAIYDNKDEINKTLSEAGKPEISTFDICWTNRPHATRKDCAWAVSMNGGDVDWNHRRSNYYVRAVTAFHTSKN